MIVRVDRGASKKLPYALLGEKDVHGQRRYYYVVYGFVPERQGGILLVTHGQNLMQLRQRKRVALFQTEDPQYICEMFPHAVPDVWKSQKKIYKCSFVQKPMPDILPIWASDAIRAYIDKEKQVA